MRMTLPPRKRRCGSTSQTLTGVGVSASTHLKQQRLYRVVRQAAIRTVRVRLWLQLRCARLFPSTHALAVRLSSRTYLCPYAIASSNTPC
jgi:hypothetical protein